MFNTGNKGLLFVSTSRPADIQSVNKLPPDIQRDLKCFATTEEILRYLGGRGDTQVVILGNVRARLTNTCNHALELQAQEWERLSWEYPFGYPA